MIQCPKGNDMRGLHADLERLGSFAILVLFLVGVPACRSEPSPASFRLVTTNPFCAMVTVGLELAFATLTATVAVPVPPLPSLTVTFAV